MSHPQRSEGSLNLRSLILVLFVVLAAACGDSSRRQPPVADTTTVDTATADPSGSPVLTLKDGTTVWFVTGRPDTSGTGNVCMEQLIELHRGDRRIPVPLLYTMGTPKAINDTTLLAALYRHCAIEAWYQVDTRTGLPKPVGGA